MYDGESAGPSEELTLKQAGQVLSIRKRVEFKKAELQKQITNLDEIIGLLDKNPDIEKFQDLVSKTRF